MPVCQVGISCKRQTFSFERTVHELGANLLGVPYFLQKASILGDTLDAEGIVFSAESINQFVVRHCGF